MGLLNRIFVLGARTARELKAIYIALGDPRTPLVAKIAGGATLFYAVWPLDLIPDILPGVGHLDDLVIVPAGLRLTISLIPPELMSEFRKAASTPLSDGKRWWERLPLGWLIIGAAIASWLLTLVAGAALWGWVTFVLRLLHP